MNLNQGKHIVSYQYELIDKSVAEIIGAWAAVEKKGICHNPLLDLFLTLSSSARLCTAV